MNPLERRAFLQALLVGAVAGGAPGWLRAQQSAHAWLAGWKTFGRESAGPTVAKLEGHWPRKLTGTLYRNGPGWFDRGGERYTHWFDGDGLMRSWRIGAGQVVHSARMIGTRKFQREQASGRFEMPAAGTRIKNPAPVRNNDDVNTANTAVVKIGDRVFALWEGGSAIEVDPDTLATRGPVTWRADLVAAPFSAHPLLESDGSAWNFGALAFFRGSGLIIWRIGAGGTLEKFQMLTSPEPGYLHAFSMTARHLIFMLVPFDRRPEGGAFFEQMRFATNRSCRVAVVPKDALDSPRWFECDFTMAYHFGDAHARGDEIFMRTVRHRDPERARAPMAAALRGETGDSPGGTDLATLRLNLRTGRTRWERHGIENLEFPTFDARTPGDQAATLYSPCDAGRAEAPYFNGVMSIDVERGRTQRWRYGAKILAEEHRFVPKPGGLVGEGWLLGTLLDHGRGRSGLALLDAQHVDEGPVAMAWVPYTTPLGFHGWFA